MFVRRTQTRSRLSGGPYVTHRLVRNERIGGRVKQMTLLNLGRHFDLPSEHWPLFCARLSELLGRQDALVAVQLPSVVEAVAQRYAAQLQPRAAQGFGQTQLPRKRRGTAPIATAMADAQLDLGLASAPSGTAHASVAATRSTLAELVDADTMELSDPRSVGVESVALHALAELGIVEQLRGAGFNRVSLAAAVGQIVARMAHPASERATHAWLQRSSGLGELWGYDLQRLSLSRLYRVADSLWRQHERVEAALYQRLSTVLGMTNTIALYDLTNTYFEGLARSNPSAKRGHSKEKRSDAPLLTLGLVLDGEGFVRRSEVFAGNVCEHKSLQGMLAGLMAAPGALVVLDRGIVTAANLAWLREHGYRYLVMSQERSTVLNPQTLHSAREQPIHWQRIEDAEAGEVRLICHSPQREVKEAAMTELARRRFEQRLEAIRVSLSKPRGNKRSARIHQRIGRLREAYPSVARHYSIEVAAEGEFVSAIHYRYQASAHSKAALPGHYVIRSNDCRLDGETLWRTYIQLTELEAVFRSLKSELGLRPIYHHLDHRCKAHLWISVLAYQCVQFLRRKLKAQGIDASWTTIRKALNRQTRVTARFATQAGGTPGSSPGQALHVRKSTAPDAEAAAIYDALGLTHKPGGTSKRLFRPERDL